MDFALLLRCWIGLAIAMSLAWLVQLATGCSGWVDAIWSLAVGIGGVVAALTPAGHAVSARQVTAAILIASWSVRLASHVALRTLGSGEDQRYAELARQWGSSFRHRLFMFLQFQALAAAILVFSVHLAAVNTAPFPRPQDIVAFALLAIAVIGEAAADAQLSAFRRTDAAASGICDRGLWRFSRHPNYFFEWLGWCAWPWLAIDDFVQLPWGWLSLSAPLLMYILLVHVSAIPPLETHMLSSRGEAYRRQQQQVNAFFPGPRRPFVADDRPPVGNWSP